MLKRSMLAVLLLGAVLHSKGQNARFSQPWSAPLMLNPSLSGNFKGFQRAGFQSSWQTSDLNRTAHQYAYLDYRITGKKKANAVGLGLSYYNYGKDLFGVIPNTSPINANFIAASLAYHLRLVKDGSQVLSFGGQVALANGQLDESRGNYEKEISGGGFRFDDLLPPPSARIGKSRYTDLNLGMNYRYNGEKIGLEAGVALYHILAPQCALADEDPGYRLRRRAVFFGKLDIRMARHSLVLSNIYWKEGLYYNSVSLDDQNLATNTIGVELQVIKPKHNTSVTPGIYTRNFRTIMPYLALNIGSGLSWRNSYELAMPSTVEKPLYSAHRAETAIIWTLRTKKSAREEKSKEIPVIYW